jgi:GT2 family glycosyltransferase
MNTRPKIGLIYLSYHSDPHLEDFLVSLQKMTYPKDRVEVIIVDNPHDEYGSSVRTLTDVILPESEKTIPRVTLLPQEKNLGFAGGNNVGARYALEQRCDYLLFHNDDGFFAPTGIEQLVAVIESDRTIGIAQALMLLYPDTEYINSRGNGYHYLGFGFTNGYREKWADLVVPEVSDIAYASGAAFIISAKAVEKSGLWDHDFFMYHEDLEWSFRVRFLGYRVVLAREAVFYHKYQFSRSIQKFFFQLRNRYAILLMYYKIPTLIFLLPILLPLEVGLWLFAVKNKWLDKQHAVYAYWFKTSSWQLWLAKRKRIQATRQISDRDMLRFSLPTIEFQEEMMKNPLLVYVGNPLMRFYYILMRLLVWW